MTHKILQSQAGPGFAVAAAAHASEMKNWRAHMARVDDDAAKGVTGPSRHIAYPRPAAHPLVASAVNENDEADFAIIDDGPTPEQILAAKKTSLLIAVGNAEALAIAAVTPVGKRRLFNLRENDIRMADAAFAASLTPRNAIGKAAEAVGIVKPIDIGSQVDANRPAADTAFLAEQSKRKASIAAIERSAAQMQSDIEDLTPETVDAWAMPKFPD